MDAFPSAIASNDDTALIEGCGNQLVSGITLCRVMEGQTSEMELFFVGPPTIKCEGKDPCITFKVFCPNGNECAGGGIPQGTSRASITWKDLLSKAQFDKGDRGEWPFEYMMRWFDTEGREQRSFSTGEIILRVYNKDYTPLNQAASDPNFVWTWSEGPVAVKMTTGMRTYVSKHP